MASSRRWSRFASFPMTLCRCESCWSRWGAQPHQLVGLAQLRRLDDLVEIGAVGVVLVAVRDVAPGLREPGGLARGLGVVLAELGAVEVQAVRVPGLRLLLARPLPHLHPVRALGARLVRLARLALVERAVRAVLAGVVVLGVVELRVGLLVGEPRASGAARASPARTPAGRARSGTARRGPSPTGALELRAPVSHRLRGRGGAGAGRASSSRASSATISGGGIGSESPLRSRPRFATRASSTASRVDGHARHRLRAEHLAPRLLQRVEHLPGLRAARHVPGVEPGIVMPHLQRHGVGLPAGARATCS